MKKNWQTIIKAIIAVLSALLGALGTSAMYNSWWTSTKEEGSPQRTSLFYCFDFNITNTLWQYRSRRLAISLVSIGNIARVDWQYRLRRLAISIASIGNIDCVIQQRQVFRRFSAVRDRSQHWAKRHHRAPQWQRYDLFVAHAPWTSRFPSVLEWCWSPTDTGKGRERQALPQGSLVERRYSDQGQILSP